MSLSSTRLQKWQSRQEKHSRASLQKLDKLLFTIVNDPVYFTLHPLCDYDIVNDYIHDLFPASSVQQLPVSPDIHSDIALALEHVWEIACPTHVFYLSIVKHVDFPASFMMSPTHPLSVISQ
jgi:hypothetical protein